MTHDQDNSPLGDMAGERKCQDWPDTHEWSQDYKPISHGMTRYCVVCGITAMLHSLRISD